LQRSQGSRREFAVKIGGGDVAAALCGASELIAAIGPNQGCAARSELWVAHASRVLAMTSRHRGLFERSFRRDAKPTRETRALPGIRIRRQAADDCRLAACAPQSRTGVRYPIGSANSTATPWPAVN